MPPLPPPPSPPPPPWSPAFVPAPSHRFRRRTRRYAPLSSPPSPPPRAPPRPRLISVATSKPPSPSPPPPPPPAHPPRTFENLTWRKVESLVARLVTQATTAAERPDLVLAVTRGGLIPATLLCEAFELRNILSATVIFYTDAGEQFFGMTEPRFLSFPSSAALEGRRVLVVDDVWDSGRTATAVRQRVLRANAREAKVAVLHFKPQRNTFAGDGPDFFAETTDNWVVYPWEQASPSIAKQRPQQAQDVDVDAVAAETDASSP